MDGSARGKVILLGEHAVVHGHSAIAAGIDRGVTARAEPGPAALVIPGWGTARPDDGTPLGRALALLVADCAPKHGRLRLTLHMDIPARAGLGSSAALAVSVARALGAPEATVAEAAHAAERIFHGNPSGIDTEAARRGGLGCYSRAKGWSELSAPAIQICIGLSGEPRSTETVLRKIGALIREDPNRARQLMDAISSLVDRGIEAVTSGNMRELGQLMDANHGYLAELGASTPELDALGHLARDAGALGAKLTGAGGGGAVIALSPGREQAILGAWQKAGYGGFLARLGNGASVQRAGSTMALGAKEQPA